MLHWFKSHIQALQTDVFGLHFSNPLGAIHHGTQLPRNRCCCRFNPGFLTLTPPRDQVLSWIRGLQKVDDEVVLAVNLKTDIVRNFSLVYDFADLILIDPDSDNGIGATDIADTKVLLDELMGLRLCYEQYTPVLLRLTHGLTHEEMQTLLSVCQLSGIDGVLVPGGRMLREARDITLGRLPLIAVTESTEDTVQALQDGACLVETHLRPVAFEIALKTLEKQAKKK